MENRTTASKIAIFKSLFTGLDHVYGTYDFDTGKVRQVKEPVTDKVILDHLTGKSPFGVYLLKGDKIKALAVDFDHDQISFPLAFGAGAHRYDINTYTERSKSKGFHVWIFFEGWVSAQKARLVVNKILADMNSPQTEVFPKQDVLDGSVSYGNFINAPLFGLLVPKGRTVFVDPAQPTMQYSNQWELLERVQRVAEVRLDGIITSCQLSVAHQSHHAVVHANQTANGKSCFGLPPCARKILTEGVEAYQRVSCFRLAVQLKRNGLPFDLTIAVLKAWSLKNRPAEGKQIISDQEIVRQVKCAFENTYRSCGCEEPAIARYCDSTCPLYGYRVNTEVKNNLKEDHDETDNRQ